MIAPRPNAISATAVTNSAVADDRGEHGARGDHVGADEVKIGGALLPGPPGGGLRLTFAGIVTEWNSEALTPEPDMAAWPTKNETNEVISETISVTAPNTISFAA